MKVNVHIGFLFLLLTTFACVKEEQNVVAKLNDEDITRAELKHWMLLEKANVYNYFFRKYKVSDSEQFWTEKLGSEVPLEVLKNKALENAKRCKVQQLLALERGIITTTNFDEILSNLEGENKERKKKIENGEPVFGPKQFTSRTYFSRVFDKMVIDLKNELAKDELKPSEALMAELIKQNEPTDKDISGFLTMQYVDSHYDAYIDKLLGDFDMRLEKEIYDKIKLN